MKPPHHSKIRRKARVFVQSKRRESYVDTIAAISECFEIDEIVLCFFAGRVEEELEDFIQNELTRIGKEENNPAYKKASKLKISSETVQLSEINAWADTLIVDTSCIGKHEAIKVAATSMGTPGLSVCLLSWVDEIRKSGPPMRVGKDHYRYDNLLEEGPVAALRKDYLAKRHVLLAFGVMFTIIIALAIAQLGFGVGVSDTWVNILSLAMGLGGLQLAYVTLKQ